MRARPWRPVTLLLALPAVLIALAPATATSQTARSTTRPPVAAPTAVLPSSEALIAPDNAPLSMAATCLATAEGRLYTGCLDGSVGVYDTARETARSVKAPGVVGPVRAIAGTGDVVWWLGSDAMLYRVSLSDAKVTRTTVVGVAGGSRRLAVFRGVVWLLGDSTLQTFDAASSEPVAVERILPRGCPSTSTIFLYVAPDGSSATLVTLRADSSSDLSVSAWFSSMRSEWHPVMERKSLASVGSRDEMAFAAFEKGCSAVGVGGSVIVADQAHDRTTVLTVPGGDLVEGSPRSATCHGRSMWWLQSGAVFRCDVEAGCADAFLPWNVPDMRVNALVADANGAWVATTQGIRRITPGAPPRGDGGYDGFVRMPMQESATAPVSPAASALADAVSAWLGVPYVYGGASQSGTDCSGFVMAAFGLAGVRLPHGSESLRLAAGGLTVRDELRYGDVLVYPGHCAIYIGNGMTAETVSGQKSVSISTIWRRRSVLVRRFLDVPLERAVVTSRHLTRPRRTGSRATRGGAVRGQRQN
jgi:hypothetical protein